GPLPHCGDLVRERRSRGQARAAQPTRGAHRRDRWEAHVRLLGVREPRSRSVASRMRRTRPVNDRPCVAEHATLSHRGALHGPAEAIATLFALIETACGESQSEKEAGRYADSFRTNISTWESQIGAIAPSLGSGSPKSVAQSKLDQAETPTVS